MMKPIAQMTPQELSRLRKHLMELVEAERDFTGVLGNKNSFFIAKPLTRRRRKTTKKAKVAA